MWHNAQSIYHFEHDGGKNVVNGNGAQMSPGNYVKGDGYFPRKVAS